MNLIRKYATPARHPLQSDVTVTVTLAFLNVLVMSLTTCPNSYYFPILSLAAMERTDDYDSIESLLSRLLAQAFCWLLLLVAASDASDQRGVVGPGVASYRGVDTYGDVILPPT
jgi:hypothetical protein